MSEHSPGPWRVAGGLVLDAREDVVCAVTRRASGPLIAAAPELLEALRTTIEAFDRVRATYLSGGSTELDAARKLVRRLEPPSQKT